MAGDICYHMSFLRRLCGTLKVPLVSFQREKCEKHGTAVIIVYKMAGISTENQGDLS
jgi:hypothetical protein